MHPYRIVLDATSVPTSLGGVGRYLADLAPLLGDSSHRVVIVARRAIADTVFTDREAYEVISVSDVLRRAAPRLLWEQTMLPLIARRADARVIHSPHYTMPLATRLARVVTIHDATFFSDPAVHSSVKGRFFRAWIRLSMRAARAVVAPSQATLDEATRYTVTPRAGIVAHHGVDREVFRPPTATEIAELRERLDLGDRPWVAFLGTLEPRKNLPALVRAFTRAVAGIPERERPVLVLAGGAGWDTELPAALADVPQGTVVLTPGYLPVELLRALLGGSTLVAYPSLGEGFGLPVLEALACGACVLTTRRLALPEVGGDAVHYSEPDEDALAVALERLLADEVLRDEYRARAAAQADRFDWTTSAAAHRAAWDVAIGERA